MKILGFSTGVVGRDSNVDRMVKALLEQSRGDTEFLKLTDVTYSGCKGCVKKCASQRVCGLEDDLEPWYAKIKEADALVLGSPVYFGGLNAQMLAFLERFFGYRHVDVAIKDKPVVVVLSGCGMVEKARDDALVHLAPFEVNVVDVVTHVSGVFPCYSCGMHKLCKIGGLYHVMGEDAHTLEITPELFSVWEDNEDTATAIAAVAETLGNG